MTELKNCEVNLTVTSPYYRNAIDYKKHLSDGWYRGKTEFTVEKYLEEMKKHFKETFRVTQNGGLCCVIIGNEIDTEEHIIQPLPSYFTYIMTKKLKWKFHEEIIWYKVTGGKRRFKVTIKHPYPTYYYPNILHESILIFRKGERQHKKDEKNRFQLNDILKKEIANSVWHIPPVPPNFIDHPCPFPEDIPYRLILLYSNLGDLVLDNFNGSGTTTKVTNKLHRKYIGYDVEEEYCRIARERLNSSLNLRNPLYPIWKKTEENLTAKFQTE